MVPEKFDQRRPLIVSLLGAFQIKHGEDLLPIPGSVVARSLLAYLFFHHQRSHTRSHLAGIFWPNLPEMRARRALSQALWNIRSCLPGIILADGQEVSIDTTCPIQVDTDLFNQLASESSTSRDQLYQAIDLYHGDLLEGEFEDWILLEQERLRERYLLMLEKLIQIEKTAGKYQQALELSLQLSTADPLREAAHQEVMRINYLLNRPEVALRQFETCTRIFHDELDTTPGAQTVALAEEIARQGRLELPPFLPKKLSKARSPFLETSTPTPIALVGRETERDALLHCLEDAFHGKGGIILIEGEAGVGKSRLLQEFGRDIQWRNLQVTWGHGWELEAARPFSLLVETFENGLTPLRIDQLRHIVDPVWLQVLHPLLPALGDQPPDISSPTTPFPSEEASRRIEALAKLLAGWSQITVLVMILEDLHWADQETLDLLPALALRLKDIGVLVVASFRSEEARNQPAVWESLQAIDRSGLLQRIQLPRLDEGQCGQFVRRCLGLKTSRPIFEKRIHRETDGNPLFVLETLRALQDHGLLQQDEEGEWHTPWDETTADYIELPLPPLVESVISRRLSDLNPHWRQVLNAAAIQGSQVEFNMLSAISNMDTVHLLDSTRELVKRHFLEETRHGYQFNHDKILQVVYGEIASQDLIKLHASAARFLEEHHPDDLTSLAYHHQQAQQWDKAVIYNQAAGEAAAALYANQKAIQYFTNALHALNQLDSPQDADRRVAILLSRQALYHRTGERPAQKADLDTLDALLKTTNSRAAQALRWAIYYEVTCDYGAMVKSAQQAIELAEREDDFTKMSEGQILWGRALNMQADAEGAQTRLNEALQNARRAGNTLGEASCLYTLARVYYDHQNRYTEAMDCCQQALVIFRSLKNREGEANALNLHCSILTDIGDLDGSIKERFEVLRLRRELGDRRGEAMTLYNLGVSHRDKGDNKASLKSIQAAAVIASETGELRLEAYCRTYLGLLLEESDPAESFKQYQHALQIRRQIGQHALTVDTLAGLARSSLQLGQVKQAKDFITEALDWVNTHGSFAVGDIILVYLAAYSVFCKTGETGQAQQVILTAYEDLRSRAAGMPEEAARSRFLNGLPQHRLVQTLYQELKGHRKIVLLPSLDNPDKMVEVSWTVSNPQDNQLGGKVDLRHHRLKRLLKEAREQGAEPGYKHLAEALGVGLRTVERDMAVLKKNNLLQLH